ncbi:MAG: glycine cleavage system aminomethyltransferase GcvT [Candidatus Aminicenantia bacterium]
MKKTRLYNICKRFGARIIDFFGWELPVEFSGIISEHLAVREKVGIFDVSHMGEIRIKGKDALKFVQFITSNDAGKLVPGKVQYTALTTPKGTPVDDLLLYKIDENEFFLVVNASNTEKDFNWIIAHSKEFNVDVKNESDEWTQLAIQGPMAFQTIYRFCDFDLSQLKYYWFKEGNFLSVKSIISRTGYTGEDGYEVYFKGDESTAEKIYLSIIDSGKEFGILPCGLGARNTLRLEAKMCLYGNDIDEDTTLLEADLGWIVNFEKGDFIGREILSKQKEEGIKKKLIGFEVKYRAPAREHSQIYINGKEVSYVRSGSYAPYLKKNIGLAYLPIEYTGIGNEFEIRIRERFVKASVVETPFYKRKK